MLKADIRWEEIIVVSDDGSILAVLERCASIGWEIPQRGDCITIGNQNYFVEKREFNPIEETWIISVTYTSNHIYVNRKEK